jgi:uncharacterized protein YfaS (alpha-2-macroglobulin family)
MTSGSIVRDTRLVVVDNIDDLYIEMNPDQEIYLPGDTASLDVNVSGDGGEGVQSALGLAIVDESVFALAEQDPGFAKLYFMLEQEILQPRFELHGFSVPDLVSGVPVSSAETVAAIEDAAQASLAAAIPETVRFSLEANSREDNLQRAYARQEKFFSGLSKGLFGLSILTALGVVVLSVVAVSRDKVLGRSILLMFGILFWLLVIFLLLPLSDYYWGGGLLDRLGAFMDYMNYEGEWFVVIVGLLGILGFIVLAVYAGVKKDPLLGWMLAAFFLLLVFLAGLIFATAMSDIYPDEGVVIAGMLAILLVPLAFLLRFSGFTMSWKVLPALAMLPLTFLLLVGIMPTFGLGMSSGVMARQVGDDFVMENAAAIEVEAAPVMGAMPEEPEMEGDAKESLDADEGASAGEAPRLRQYFPETMFWMPDALTDEDGSLTLEIPVADSITTWRITALASSQDGRLGSTTGWMKVFQDFFIDLDLPLSLTVGDEVSVPVGVFNYMTEPQSVRLELQQEDWFELLDEPVKEIDIAANDISVVYFRVRALDFGRQPFQVTALGSKMSDAILKEVRVYPDGKQIRFSQSDRLNPDEPVTETVNIPADAIAGTQTLTVKIYPGVVSQIVEGLDSILRMPFGCFEQTSSTTYPNLLVMDYLKTSGQISPEVQMKAEEYINLGYQRLTTFEVGGSGGFSLFGDAPADPMLTAYGLQEFTDMSRVHNVDPAIIQRIAAWLQAEQKSDGSWEGVSGFHETGLTNMVERLPVSAYVVWGLADAGYGEDASTQLGAQYLREFQSQADDAYALALVANALVAVDVSTSEEISSTTMTVLDRLAGMAIKEGNVAYWQNETETVMGGYGDAGALETTALAALAMLRSDTHPELANAALTYLVQGKDSFGTWDTTQATVMSLKAFLESVRGGSEDVNAEVMVTLNDGQTRTAQVTPQNFDVVQYLVFDDINIGRDNVVEIIVSGEGNLMYQVAGSYYLPWEALSMYPDVVEAYDLVTIDVRYDRTEITVNDTVEVTVKVTLNEMDGVAESALIDLGLPPGFTVQAEDLATLVNYYNDTPEDYAFPTIQRYELTGRQIIVYISNLSYEDPMEFSYRLLAKFPLQVQTPASTAYDYYNPAVSGEEQPQMLVVVE